MVEPWEVSNTVQSRSLKDFLEEAAISLYHKKVAQEQQRVALKVQKIGLSFDKNMEKLMEQFPNTKEEDAEDTVRTGLDHLITQELEDCQKYIVCMRKCLHSLLSQIKYFTQWEEVSEDVNKKVSS